MQLPILAGCLWIPYDVERHAARLRAAYTVKYRPMGEPEVSVPAYVRADGYVGIPRHHGLQSIANFEDQRALGRKVVFPKEVKLRDYQVPFVQSMHRAAQAEFSDFLAKAATGKGKTVCSLEVIRRMGRAAVVVVDQERLMDQWIERAQEFLGLRDNDIGIVQGSKCEFEGKKLVVAMVQTLYQRVYDESFYDYFGVAVFDEAHVAGAPMFSRALLQFPAKVRFGVSATPDRKDALNKIIRWSLGQIEASLEDRHLASRVYYLESTEVVSWYANKATKAGRYITELSELPRRNLLIARAIKWLYDSGRTVLAISDRIEQLSFLMELCAELGVPEEEMGVYARYRTRWGYEKHPTPPRLPPNYERDTEFTPVRLAPLPKRTKPAELRYVLENAKIIFATYQMFKKGVDVPRLSGGIDCTPVSDAVQVHGRILRTMKGKKIPIWVTIRDINSFRAENQFMKRLGDYAASNAEVFEWKLDKGVRQVEVEDLRLEARQRALLLKQQRIVTRYDGGFTVLMQDTQSACAAPPETITGRTTRSLRAV